MVYPVKPWSRARVSAGFLDPEYRNWRVRAGLPAAEHPGIDINVGAPGNWDDGYPVRAIYRGVVTHAGRHRVWGNIVVIWHPGLNVWTQYAHLRHMSVEEGMRVCEGEDIGSIGRGDPMRPFVAHLHFEVRLADLPPDYWPGVDRDFIKRNYLDPMHLFKKFDASDEVRGCWNGRSVQ